MMFKKSLAVLCTAAMLVLSLAACGGSSSGGSASEDLSGSYKLTGMTEDGEEMSAEDLEAMESLGLEVTLEMNEDGTGTLDLFGETMELEWGDGKVSMDGEAVDYTLDGSTLTFSEDDTELVFEKQ